LTESGVSCRYLSLDLGLMRFISIPLFELFLRQEMRMPLAGRRQCASHRFLGIAAIGLRGLVSRESAALALGKLGFL
jgi:hypothetical protein